MRNINDIIIFTRTYYVYTEANNYNKWMAGLSLCTFEYYSCALANTYKL